MQKWNLIGILPIASLLILTGCGGDSAVVSDLKEKEFPVDSTLNYEQALDRRAVCDSTSWAVSEDNRGREVVRYECDLKGVEEFNDDFVAQNGGESADLNLVSEATHFIEWFHNEGEYSLNNTSVYLYADNGADEQVELSEYASFHAAIDDDVSGLSGFLAVLQEHANPWGW